MSSIFRAPVAIATMGAGLFLAWGAFVLPLIGLGLRPVPGKELQVLALSIVPPITGSALLLAGGLVGLQRRRRAGARPASLGSLAFGCVALIGALAAIYTSLLLCAVL